MSKSALYVANASSVATAAGAAIQLGSTVRRYGCNAHLNGNAIELSGGGYYSVAVSVTAAPNVAGAVSATLYKDGSAVTGATASAVTSDAKQSVSLSFSCIVKLPMCKCLDDSSLTLELGGSDSVVSNVAVEVVKL